MPVHDRRELTPAAGEVTGSDDKPRPEKGLGIEAGRLSEPVLAVSVVRDLLRETTL